MKEKPDMMTDQCDQLLRSLETERRYVARELHDGLAQSTLQLGLRAGICRKFLEQGKLELLADELARLEEHCQLSSGQVRDLISDMRHPMVEPDATLNDYVLHLIELHHERGGPAVTYRFDWSSCMPNLSPAQLITLVRIVQEALLNIRKHAQAENAWLTFSHDEEKYAISIVDDGQGFDLLEIDARPLDKGGAGLANMQARAKALDGTLFFGRNLTGQGTALTLTLSKNKISSASSNEQADDIIEK